MLHRVFVGIILKSNITRQRTSLVIRPGVYQLAVDSQRIIFADTRQLVTVPIANFFKRQFDRSMKGIKRTRAFASRFGFADFKLMALSDRDHRIISRIGKSHEDARIGIFAGLAPLSAQYEIGVGAVGVPPKSHSALTGGDAILHFKTSGTALRPAVFAD